MAKPKLCLIPSSQGDKLYSVLPSSGVGDFDFSRSGGATRINSQGLIETVASGVSRLNYPMIDGKVVGCPSHLLEPQRTQKVQYSEDFTAWNKFRALITSNQAISPKGSLNSDFLFENDILGTHLITLSGTITSGVYTMSVFVKSKERTKIGLANDSTSDSDIAKFDLSNGTIISNGLHSAKIEEYENGWYRCSITSTTSTPIRIMLLNALGNSSYTGDGTSGIYIFGAQVEQGSYPTSYIPNYGTALGVTRSAETATNSGDASTFNDSEGVLMAEISALADDGTDRVLGVSDGSANNRIILYYNSSNNLVAQVYSISNNLQSTITVTDLDITNFSKASIKYDTNSIKLYLNGFLRESKSIATAPINLSELAFDNGIGGADFYGKTKEIAYYDEILTDAELEYMTSYRSLNEMVTELNLNAL